MESRDIIIRPIVTEDTQAELANKRYVFEVNPNSTKTQIKWAIEDIFDVNVEFVNTANVQGKTKRQGNFVGKRRKRKKATVQLASDSNAIEQFNQN